jgi:hypothetical protein
MSEPRRVHYGRLPGLKDVYLEDSYVLGIGDEPPILRITLLLVLRENHPQYAPPEGRERYCYRLAVLEFRDVVLANWSRRSLVKYRDADGRVDYGNIDVFYREVDGSYHLEGDWGTVDITSGPPVIKLTR